MSTISNAARENNLKTKRCCRFCLSQAVENLSSIYSRETRLKTAVPLPVQVMAIASMEVYSNDGMPTWVCIDCRLLFDHAYRFKQMCKRAETLLRQYPLTGQWPIPLTKPTIPKELLPKQQVLAAQTTKTTQSPGPASSKSLLINTNSKQQQMHFHITAGGVNTAPKKILNSNPVSSPEPPAPVRFKKEKLDEETDDFLSKFENNEELSMDDVQRLIAAAVDDDEEFVGITTTTTEVEPVVTSPLKKRKLLNKSSIRILNKEAEVVVEPRLSKPQVKRDEDGNVAIVSEILDPNVPYEMEPDPIKNAAPVETNVFPCPHCERSFPLLQLRDIHMVNHNRDRSYQCINCEKSFFSKYDLQKHSLIHTGDKPFKCTVCEKAFTRASLLHRHEKTHTDIPKFICIYCEKPFISKDEMEKHTERHRKNRPYHCKLCNKAFAFKQGLERHEVVHSRDQPYPCQYCEQSFSTPSKLARHLTAHAGKRPYPCKFCPKSYLLSHHLTRHMRSHKQSSTLFTCNDCDKVYKTRDELIYHSAVHATQTLICPLCKESFDEVDDVTLHIRQHAEGEAFACEFCDLIFMTSERLQEHTDVDHAEDMVAYHEDDNKAMAQNTKKDIETDAEDADVDNSESIISKFLINELPHDVQILNDQMLHGDDATAKNDMVIKEENETNKLQILNQIVIQKPTATDGEENYVMLDDSILVANEAEEMDDVDAEFEIEAQLACEPPIKMKKFYKCGNNKPQADMKMIEKNKTQPPPQLRRKVAVSPAKATATIGNQSTEIKIENNDQTIAAKTSPKQQAAINSVLKALPKSVSVRRNTPAAAESNTSVFKLKKTTSSPARKQSPTTEAAKQPPSQQKQQQHQQGFQRPAAKNVSPGSQTKPKIVASTVQQQQLQTRSAAKRTSNEANENVKTSPQTKSLRSPVDAKSSPSTVTSSAATASTSKQAGGSGGNDKVVKMMIGDKKVKMQKITITRAEASAMVKEGRIRIKDGNMILTQNSPKSSK